MSKKTRFWVNTIFVIILALTLIWAFVDASKAETDREPTTQATTEEATEYITEPSQEETEATELAESLYDIPLDAELQVFIGEKAMEYGIDPTIIFAMAFYESSYNPKASNGGGYTLGLLQVQPRWHKKRMERLNCPDLLDPYQNVTVAVDYLAEQIERYDGDVAKGIVAYNKGHYAGKITYYAKAVMKLAAELRGETT